MLFGSTLLEVSIGMVFVYLLLSLLCSALAELIESFVRFRARDLEKGIRSLLNDKKLVTEFFDHPLIKPLGDNRSYIPARTFSLALWNIATTKAAEAQAAVHAAEAKVAAAKAALEAKPVGAETAETRPAKQSAAAAAPAVAAGVTLNLPQIRGMIAGIEDKNLQNIKTALLTLIDEAGGDITKARANVEQWYNDAMDRVSGWYKRRTHWILVVLGLLAAIVFNVDTIGVVKALWFNDALRSSVAAAAENYAKTNPTPPPASSGGTTMTPEQEAADARRKITNISSQINSLDLPVGWPVMPRLGDPKYQGIKDAAARQKQFDADTAAYNADPRWWAPSEDHWGALTKLLGIILTALAVSQGAPFWFDMLNKLIVIRSTVKPREKSHDEGSKDKTSRPVDDHDGRPDPVKAPQGA